MVWNSLSARGGGGGGGGVGGEVGNNGSRNAITMWINLRIIMQQSQS